MAVYWDWIEDAREEYKRMEDKRMSESAIVIPVVFRKDKTGEVSAVFPTLKDGAFMTCYAHVGQHSSCSMGWYRETVPANKEEYAGLLKEIKGIYTDCELRIVKRISH